MKKAYLVLTMVLVMSLTFTGGATYAEGDIDAAYEIGMVYFDIGDMNGAISKLSTVSESSPQYVQAQSAIIQAKAKLRDQQMVIVDVYLSAGDYQTASEKLEAMMMDMPGDSVVLTKYGEVMALMSTKKTDKKVDSLARAEEQMNQRDFESAIKILEESLKIMPDDVELNAAYIKATLQYKEDSILKIDALRDAKRYDEAEMLMTKLCQIFPKDEELEISAYRLSVSEEMDRVAKLEAEGDLAGAIGYLNTMDEGILQTPEVSELMVRLCSTYRQNVVREAEMAYQTEGYTRAAQIIQKGQTVLRDDDQLHELWKMYADMAPVSLLDEYDYFENKWSYVDTNEKDNLGNIYEKVIAPSTSYSDTYISFYIDGKYEKLTGTVFLCYSRRSTDRKQKLKIFGDELLLYESGDFTAGVLPEHFEVDITGVKNLRFETSGSYGLIEIGDIYVQRCMKSVNTKSEKQNTAAQSSVYETVGFQPMKVSVDVDDKGKIERVQVLEHQEIPGFGADLIADAQILEKLIGQDIRTAQIDMKSGVTLTSSAINNALSQAANDYTKQTGDQRFGEPTSYDLPKPEQKSEQLKGHVILTVNGRQYGDPIPMDREKIITLKQEDGKVNKVHITPEKVYMESSTCDNQDCVEQGEVHVDTYKNRILSTYIICLPNNVQVEMVPAE